MGIQREIQTPFWIEIWHSQNQKRFKTSRLIISHELKVWKHPIRWKTFLLLFEDHSTHAIPIRVERTTHRFQITHNSVSSKRFTLARVLKIKNTLVDGLSFVLMELVRNHIYYQNFINKSLFQEKKELKYYTRTSPADSKETKEEKLRRRFFSLFQIDYRESLHLLSKPFLFVVFEWFISEPATISTFQLHLRIKLD